MTETFAQSARQSAKRIFRNARTLLSGKALGGVLSLGYLAIAARSLGPTDMGYLVLAHAYVLITARIARFQSWQAVNRFGAPLISDGNIVRFKTLVRFTAKMDLLSAGFAILAAAGLAYPVSRLMNWPAEAMPYIYAYCFVAPFLMLATPTGVLRLFDRFKILGAQLILLPGARFAGALGLWITGGGLKDFLIVWIISAILHGGSLWVLGWLELKKRNLLPRRLLRPGERASPEWLPFMIKTNLSSTVNLAQHNLPVLFVGALLGSAASGFLQLAINLSNLIAHPTNMLTHATFPEFSKMNVHLGHRAVRDVAFRSIVTATMVAAPIVLVFMIFGEELAVTIGGTSFAPAAGLVALMGFSQLWRIASVVFESAVLATGRAGYVLTAQVASALVNIAVLWSCIPLLGPNGAPAAIIGGWTVLLAMYLFALFRWR